MLFIPVLVDCWTQMHTSELVYCHGVELCLPVTLRLHDSSAVKASSTPQAKVPDAGQSGQDERRQDCSAFQRQTTLQAAICTPSCQACSMACNAQRCGFSQSALLQYRQAKGKCSKVIVALLAYSTHCLSCREELHSCVRTHVTCK